MISKRRKSGYDNWDFFKQIKLNCISLLAEVHELDLVWNYVVNYIIIIEANILFSYARLSPGSDGNN